MARAGERADAIETAVRHSFGQLESTGSCGVLGGHRHGTYGVAVPVVVGRQRVVMALSCGKADLRPDLEAERRRIAPALKEAARELEETLADVDGQP